MATYKNIKIPKRGGGSRLQRVQVLASGKYKFVKNLVKSKSKPRKAKTNRKTTKRKNNPKKGGNRNMGKNTTQSIYKVARIVAGVGPFVEPWIHTDWSNKTKVGLTFGRLTGYRFDHGHWELHRLVEGYGPLVATVGAQKAVSFVRKLIRGL